MSLERIAYLVNSTPRYYGLLPIHFQLIRRYFPEAPFDLILATEVPEHPICVHVAENFGVKLLQIYKEDAGFLDSRTAALRDLAALRRYDYVIPVQEDFLLDRSPFLVWLEGCLSILRTNTKIASIRLMPSPGPEGPECPQWSGFREVTAQTDTYGFTFQATLWRLDACLSWYEFLCNKLEVAAPRATTDPKARIHLEVRQNFAENADGQQLFWKWSAAYGYSHIGWKRAGPWSNSVYLCPWPYRPTAIVQGKLEPWAAEMIKREGLPPFQLL